MIKTLLIFLLILIAKSYSDIVPLDVIQGNVYPADSSEVIMVDEYVLVTLKKTYPNVYARFKMYNSGNAIRTKVGFPINETTYKDDFNPDIDQFWCQVNDQFFDLKMTKERLEHDNYPSKIFRWYYWEMTFPGKDTTVIEIGYTGKWLEEFPVSEFRYLIGTGKYWNGSIGKGQVVFDHSALATSLFVYKHPIYMGNKDLRSPLYSHSFDVTYSEDLTIVKFTNYNPDPGETIDIAFVSFWSNHISSSEAYHWNLKYHLDESSKSDLYLMRNEILARKGHKFSDKKLIKYFYAKKWYVPTKIISLEELTEAEKYVYDATLKYEEEQ